MLPYTVTFFENMGKVRRGGLFSSGGREITRRGMSMSIEMVYRDGKLIIKWDLDNKKAMKGSPTKRVVDLIARLQSEGVL